MTATASPAPPDITPADILAVVSDYFRTPIADLVGASRSPVLAQARQSAMYLCCELTELSASGVGLLFGGRDHTEVIVAERKIRHLMTERFEVRNRILEMTAQLRLLHR